MIPKRITDTYIIGTVAGSRDIRVMSTDPHVQLDLVVFVVIWRAENWANLAGVIALRKPRAITWTTKVRHLHDSFENLMVRTQATLATDYLLECPLKAPEHIDPEAATIGDLVTCVRRQVYATKGWKKKLCPERPDTESVKSMTPTWFAKHPPVQPPARHKKVKAVEKTHRITLPYIPGAQMWVMWENAPKQVTVTQLVITVPPAEHGVCAVHAKAHFESYGRFKGEVDAARLFPTKEALLASL